MLLSNVLDTKGEGVGEGIPLPWRGLFFNRNLGNTKSRFGCILKFKLTSILTDAV